MDKLACVVLSLWSVRLIAAFIHCGKPKTNFSVKDILVRMVDLWLIVPICGRLLAWW